MAIRGPARPEAALAPIAREQATSPLQRLIDFGMARTPTEAHKVLGEIIALLGGAGFPVAKLGSPEQQLQTALRDFQHTHGLKGTGQLDEATARALERAGLVPPRADVAVDPHAGRKLPRDVVDTGARPGLDLGLPRLGVGGVGGVGGGAGGGGPLVDGGSAGPSSLPKSRQLETEAAIARVTHGRPDVEVDLRSMLGALRAAGFAGAGKGTEQLKDAIKKLQRVDGLPVTGALDAATATALERRGVLDAATAQALREQDPRLASHSPAAQTTSIATTSSATTSNATTSSATTSNTTTTTPETTTTTSAPAAGAHADAPRDHIASGDRHHGEDGGLASRGDPGVQRSGAADTGDTRPAPGNAVAGTIEDDDPERGRANRDDDDADDAFQHWEVPSVHAQIEAAWPALERDDDGRGPATYGWVVVLHRPGIYAAGQPAPVILKLEVRHAGPFDPVWDEAVLALNSRLRAHDDDAPPLTRTRVAHALQRARYR
jgi:hypothetical protein